MIINYNREKINRFLCVFTDACLMPYVITSWRALLVLNYYYCTSLDTLERMDRQRQNLHWHRYSESKVTGVRERKVEQSKKGSWGITQLAECWCAAEGCLLDANSQGKSTGQCQDFPLWLLFHNTCPTAALEESAWHHNTKTQRERPHLQTWQHIWGGGEADK